jgi:hypothetical protein
MKLGVKERYQLLSILPPVGTFSTLRIVRQLREALSFSEDEIASFGITEANETARWERSADREFAFKPRALSVIVETLQKMDKEGTLPAALVGLAEKFLGGSDDEEAVERGDLVSPVPAALEARNGTPADGVPVEG